VRLNPSPRFCIHAESNNRAGPPFVGRLWQRNDYEHIIRDARELERIREYILNNPANWATDEDSIAVSPASEPQGERSEA